MEKTHSDESLDTTMPKDAIPWWAREALVCPGVLEPVPAQPTSSTPFDGFRTVDLRCPFLGGDDPLYGEDTVVMNTRRGTYFVGLTQVTGVEHAPAITGMHRLEPIGEKITGTAELTGPPRVLTPPVVLDDERIAFVVSVEFRDHVVVFDRTTGHVQHRERTPRDTLQAEPLYHTREGLLLAPLGASVAIWPLEKTTSLLPINARGSWGDNGNNMRRPTP